MILKKKKTHVISLSVRVQVERRECRGHVERSAGARSIAAARAPVAHGFVAPVHDGHRPYRVQRDGGRGRGHPPGQRGRVVHRRSAQRRAGRHPEEVSVRTGEGHPQRQVHTASLAAPGRIQHGNHTALPSPPLHRDSVPRQIENQKKTGKSIVSTTRCFRLVRTLHGLSQSSAVLAEDNSLRFWILIKHR